jgi:hypothetical protein
MIYQIEDARLVSYNYSMPVNNQMAFDAEFSFEVTETKGLKLSGSYYPASPWNSLAHAYISKVEEYDSYMFSNAQKDAIGEFFDALEWENLHTKIKKMWLVGFSNEAALRDVITPSEKEGWEDTPSAAPAGAGFATYDNDAKMVVGADHPPTMADLGIAVDDCGAFFAGTNMTQQPSSYVSTWEGPSLSGKMMQLQQAGMDPYPTTFRAGNINSLDSTDDKQDGVFVASRNVNNAYITRIKGGRVAENATQAMGGGEPPPNPIYIWSKTTKGDVSTAGITLGLTAAQTETLAGLIYDLCVGIGHTDLEDTT